MEILRSISNWKYIETAEEMGGWLPADAATPLKSENIERSIDVRVVDFGEGEILLIWNEVDSAEENDAFCGSVEAALETAAEYFGIKPGDWRIG